MIPSIEKIKAAIASSKGFVFKNKYNVNITTLGENFGLYAGAVDIPAQDFTTIDLNTGGRLLGITNMWAPAELIITFYNSGEEYAQINEYGAKLYDQESHAFAYYDDIVMDIEITEMRVTGETAWKANFQNCLLRGIGPISLSYMDSTEVESFTATFSVEKIEIIQE